MIYGRRTVLEALRGRQRPRRIWVARGAGGLGLTEILAAAAERGVPLEEVPRERIQALVGNAVHQGVAAEVPPFRYEAFERLVAAPGPRLLVALDRVYDPHNLGAVARNAEAFGASGLVIPTRHAGSVTAAARKAAAGALELLAVARVPNLARALDHAKRAGFWVIALDPRGGTELGQVEAPGDRLLLLLGSEGRGIRPVCLARADLVVAIGMRGRVGSLNVASAAAIALYHLSRAWGGRGAEPGVRSPGSPHSVLSAASAEGGPAGG